MCTCLLGSTVTILNGPILAEDKDVGPNAVVKYHLLGPRVDLFNVDPDTGKMIPLPKVNRMELLKRSVLKFTSLRFSSRCYICASRSKTGP